MKTVSRLILESVDKNVTDMVINASGVDDIVKAMKAQYGNTIPLYHATDEDAAQIIDKEGLKLVKGNNRIDYSDDPFLYFQIGKSDYKSNERPVVYKYDAPLKFIAQYANADMDGVDVSEDDVMNDYGVDISELDVDTREFIMYYVWNNRSFDGMELILRNTDGKFPKAINAIKESLTINEAKKKDPNKFGCLMLGLEYDDSKIKALFEDKDLFKDEGGYEDMHHITILYGFHDEVKPDEVLEMAINKSNLKNRKIELNRVSLFKHEKFDVVKFDIMDSEINKLNKLVADNFPYTNKYPVYHAHSTIAYVNPGEGEKYLTKLKNIKTTAKAVEFIFSTKTGKISNSPL